MTDAQQPPDLFDQVAAYIGEAALENKWVLYTLARAELVAVWVNNSYLGEDLQSVEFIAVELEGGVKVYFWLIDAGRMTARQCVRSLAAAGIHAIERSAGPL